jgi:hemerythrin-like metal-binding protein
MTLLQWNEDLELHLPAMDATHREFVDLLNALAEAEDAGFAAALDRLIEHTVAHFAQEDRWMEETEFGVLCHIAEHQQVLQVMRKVREMIEAGDLRIGRKLAGELAPWFEHHASTMDTMLASHMAQKGYAPEVVWRVPAGQAVSAAARGCCSAQAEPEPAAERVAAG